MSNFNFDLYVLITIVLGFSYLILTVKLSIDLKRRLIKKNSKKYMNHQTFAVISLIVSLICGYCNFINNIELYEYDKKQLLNIIDQYENAYLETNDEILKILIKKNLDRIIELNESDSVFTNNEFSEVEDQFNIFEKNRLIKSVYEKP